MIPLLLLARALFHSPSAPSFLFSHSCCIYNIYLLVSPSHFEGNLTLERISEIDFYALLLRLPLPSPLTAISLCTPAPIIHSQTLQLNLCSAFSHYGRNCYNSITRFLAGSRPRRSQSQSQNALKSIQNLCASACNLFYECLIICALGKFMTIAC